MTKQQIIKLFLVSSMLVLGTITFINVLTNFPTQWYWLILATLWTMTINDIFVHRICSHRLFDINTKSLTYKILVYLNAVELGYTLKDTVLTHHLHHKHSDKGPEDVMNWRYYWYSTGIIFPLPLFGYKHLSDEYYEKHTNLNRDVLTDKWTNFCYQYDVYISILSIVILYFLLPTFLFNVIFLGRFLLSLFTSLAAICGHIKNFPLSYRNFNTDDTTSNNLLFYYLTFGLFTGMLQNNHHAKPRTIKPNCKWWEIDLSYYVILFLKRQIEKKPQLV